MSITVQNALYNSKQHINISFLDLVIIRKKQYSGRYIQTAATDTNILYNSSHPIEHELLAYRLLFSRVDQLFLNIYTII
jgi:hypothetical protein